MAILEKSIAGIFLALGGYVGRFCLAIYPWITGFIAIFYGLVLSQIPDEQFKDFNNYLIYADNGLDMLLGGWGGGLLAFVANEPIWLLINTGLIFLLEPDAVVRIIIFFSATTVAWSILINRTHQSSWWILFLFLLFPSVVKNHLIHLRQGFAIAIFLFGWFANKKNIQWIFFGISSLIHSSFFVVLCILWLTNSLRYIRLGFDIKIFIFFIFGLSAGFGLEVVTDFFGARQSQEYKFAATDVSGLGFGFWCFILVIWLSAGRSFLEKHVFETGFIIFYLSTYWLIEVASRIFESGLVLVLLAGLCLPPRQRKLFIYSTGCVGCFMWFVKIGSPALGFGIGS